MASSGKIIKADITETSNDNLKKTLSIRSDQDKIIFFKDVILNARQYYVIKLLVLHPVDQVPTIKPLGYIAGMETIKVRETYKVKGKISAWSQAFAGSWGAHTLRLIVYFFGAALVFLLLVAIITFVGEQFEKSKLKGHVRRFKKHTELSLNESDEFIFSQYIWGMYNQIRFIENILENDDSLRMAWSCANTARANQPIFNKLPKSFKRSYPSTHDELMLTFIDPLIKSGFVQDKDGVLIVDPHMKETLKSFLAYLRDHGLTR